MQFLTGTFSFVLLYGFFFISNCVQSNPKNQSDPIYLGNFEFASHGVAGDIFLLNKSIFYIQDFAHDGRAPDVVFQADGVPVPYVTRYTNNNLIQTNQTDYNSKPVAILWST